MLRNLGIGMGLLFLLGGILGFVPGVTKNDMFLGVFMVNTPHSFMHLGSGGLMLIASFFGNAPARRGFQVFGIFYGVVAVMGFFVGDAKICGVISNNFNDSWGHGVLALVLLAIGFATPKPTATA
jgi:Domain of unknown function (DUF4383)